MEAPGLAGKDAAAAQLQAITSKIAKATKQAEYFKLYAETAKAIKRAHPRLRVGGPATAGSPTFFFLNSLPALGFHRDASFLRRTF